MATTTCVAFASKARSQTWAIMGLPAISSKGLPGRRVESKRAGMTTLNWLIDVMRQFHPVIIRVLHLATSREYHRG